MCISPGSHKRWIGADPKKALQTAANTFSVCRRVGIAKSMRRDRLRRKRDYCKSNLFMYRHIICKGLIYFFRSRSTVPQNGQIVILSMELCLISKCLPQFGHLQKSKDIIINTARKTIIP